MYTSLRLGVMSVLIAFVCASCAVSPEAEERRQRQEEDIQSILSEPIDVEKLGTTKRCLSDHEFRSFRVLDDRRILFIGRHRGRLWLNTLKTRCQDLRFATALRVKGTLSSDRICRSDSFQAGDWFDFPWYRRWPWHWGRTWSTGAICMLGDFQPVTEEQVEAIERVLESP